MLDLIQEELDPTWEGEPIEYLRMFFIFDSVLETSALDSMDALELFEIIQGQTLQ